MRRLRWSCPCGSFAVIATRRADLDLVDRALGEHFKECPVAQADVIARQAVVDGQSKSE